jgi:hypothetical protein
VWVVEFGWVPVNGPAELVPAKYTPSLNMSGLLLKARGLIATKSLVKALTMGIGSGSSMYLFGGGR